MSVGSARSLTTCRLVEICKFAPVVILSLSLLRLSVSGLLSIIFSGLDMPILCSVVKLHLIK